MSLRTFFSSISSKISFIRKWYTQHKQQVWTNTKVWLLIFFCGSIFFVGLYRFVRPPFTLLQIARVVQQIDSYQWPIWQRDRVQIEDISSQMVYAVIAAEDNKFVSHFGFDIPAVQKAILYNASQERSVLGWSTISQQTAKNVFLWPHRSIIRKWLEAYFTLLIEALWSKARILEVYLNVIEFGNGIYGVGAAAQHYFHTSAAKLTTSQSAFLAALLPNPRYYDIHPQSYQLVRRKSQIIQGIKRVGWDRQTRTFVKSVQ